MQHEPRVMLRIEFRPDVGPFRLIESASDVWHESSIDFVSDFN